MKIKDLLAEIEKTLKAYETELQTLKEKFTRKETDIKNKIAEVNKKGIAEQLSASYLQMADIFAHVLADLQKVQEEFSFEKYAAEAQKSLSALKPRVAGRLGNDNRYGVPCGLLFDNRKHCLSWTAFPIARITKS